MQGRPELETTTAIRPGVVAASEGEDDEQQVLWFHKHNKFVIPQPIIACLCSVIKVFRLTVLFFSLEWHSVVLWRRLFYCLPALSGYCQLIKKFKVYKPFTCVRRMRHGKLRKNQFQFCVLKQASVLSQLEHFLTPSPHTLFIGRAMEIVYLRSHGPKADVMFSFFLEAM